MTDDARWVRDRLEVTDLVHRYAHHADAGNMEAWLGLFTDDVEVDMMGTLGGHAILRGYRDAAASAPPSTDRTRHVMTNLVFTAQDDAGLAGSTYLTFVRTRDGKARVEATGCYDFRARRTPAGWRLSMWRAALDGALA